MLNVTLRVVNKILFREQMVHKIRINLGPPLTIISTSHEYDYVSDASSEVSIALYSIYRFKEERK